MIVAPLRIGAWALPTATDADAPAIPTRAFPPTAAVAVLLQTRLDRPHIHAIEDRVHAGNAIDQLDDLVGQLFVINVAGQLDDARADGLDINRLVTRASIGAQPSDYAFFKAMHITTQCDAVLLADFDRRENPRRDRHARTHPENPQSGLVPLLALQSHTTPHVIYRRDADTRVGCKSQTSRNLAELGEKRVAWTLINTLTFIPRSSWLISPTNKRKTGMRVPGPTWGEVLRAPFNIETLTAASSYVAAVRPRLFGARGGASTANADLRLLFGASPTVLCLTNASGRVRAITPNAARVLGEACDRAAELNVGAAELLQADALEVQTVLDDLSRSDALASHVWTLKTRAPSGESRWLELAGRNLLFDPEVGALLFEIRDVTRDHALNERQHVLGHALEQSTDAVIVTNAQGFIEYVNSAFEQVSGYRLAELRGRTPGMLKADRQAPEFYQRMWTELKKGAVFRGEIANRKKNGEIYYEDIVIEPVCDAKGNVTHFVSSARDITLRKRTETQSDSAAFYDSVTSVSTFKLLRERSRQILALARRHGLTAALLHVDLKGLAAVNASHGRAIGDELLRKFADRLKQGLRESDAIARLDNDEFLILLSDVAEEDATARVVRRLRESVSRPYQIKDQSLNIGASFGVALYPQDATTFDELLEYSMLATKRALSASTGYEFYNKQVTEITTERLSLEDDLRWAWDHKQFVLHYQPVVALNSGRVIGAEALARGHIIGMEALARWPHMQRGEILPAQFIPMAERTGRIVALDRWAIATAAKQVAAWSQDGWQGWVAVNLSARSLHDADLPAYISQCFDANGLGPGRLILEITESAAMRDTEMTARILKELRAAGVLIALDDFGIGHSSLAYLKHFPVDILKLDRNFVEDIGRANKQELLIETMITLAHKIGAQVVAEGVEAASQLGWLKDAGCDFAQGYLVGRPQPAESAFNVSAIL